ncbi:hypothetical protein GcM3_105016 [Golovinomyces cichoracearum]|uniref:Rhodopsin domain-containing protein n=1 Tax=Golovinomyces cichoracearum TaxID=62708 RepID=A0A420I9N5_9PEZI|nr:hypothetical protein GcM3_105016 [Golovinomyces cichoracearum]
MRSLGILERENSISAIDKGHQVTGVAYLALIFPSVAVCLRIYVRLGIQKRMGNDDYLAIASLNHLTNLREVRLVCALRIIDSKLSTFWPWVSPHFTLSVSFSPIISHKLCLRNTLYSNHCSDETQHWVLLSAINPKAIPTTNNIRHHVHRYLCVNCLLAVYDFPMSAGALPMATTRKAYRIRASIATIFRMVHIHSLKSMTDFTWEGIGLIKWSLIEPAIALTAATLATLRPLTQKLFSSKKIPPKLSIKTRHGLTRKSSVCHSSEFAEMLGLAVSPGARTQVYADSTVETPIPHTPLWSGWRDNQKGLWSPLRSPRHDGEDRTFSLGLKTLKNGSWVFKNDAGGGIMRTIVVTRNVGS